MSSYGSSARPAAVPAVVPFTLRASRWTAFAWGAIAVTTLFVAISCWWLTQDRSLPGTEPGAQITAAIEVRNLLAEGHLLGPLTFNAIHPPLITFVGAVSMLVGGIDIGASIAGENLVFVPLLALGCYQTGKLVGGPRVGLLAVVFALGSPLVTEQFHVLMVDAPQTALVAVAVWLILASERFSRLGYAAAAGAAVGLGLENKQQFPFFLVGLLVVLLAREQGWRNWRGIALFAGVTFVVGCPWYLAHISQLSEYTHDSVTAASPGTLPNRLSLTNVVWYFWALLNSILFAPLFAFLAIGTAKAADLLRRGDEATPRWLPELLGGVLGCWVALSINPIHVSRYMMPMIVYFAVLGTFWIVRLGRTPRLVATGALALAVLASTLGASFGAGGRVSVPLTAHAAPDRSVFGIPPRDQVVLYSNRDFLVAGPHRDGDLLTVFEAMHRDGVRAITWFPRQEQANVFDGHGIYVFAQIAHLGSPAEVNFSDLAPHLALLIRAPTLDGTQPCARLSDGTGVWIRLGRALEAHARDYCPLRRPKLYGP